MVNIEPSNKKFIFALFLVHFSGDFFQSFVKPLLPVLATKFSLTLTQVGMIGGLSMLTAFFIQPVFGYLADRHNPRFIALAGVVFGAICIPLVGIASGYGFILIFIGIGSMGSAMFHPSAAGMVSLYTGRHAGLSMSLFGMGGTIAFAIGPVVLAWYVTLFGLERLPYFTLFGLLFIPILITLLPIPQKTAVKEHTFFITLRESLGNVWKPIMIIWALAFTRALLEQATFTFIPMLFSAEGYSLMSIGTIVSLFTVGGSISSLACGHLVDRFGFKPVYYFSFAFSTPSLYLFVHSADWLAYALSFLSGFFIFGTLFPAVALAQKVASKSRSLVSSLIMGLAMGTGGILMPFIGRLADNFGIRPVLSCIALIPFLMLVFVRYLPDPR
ncbi:MFS transporter [Thermodesulfobacteriota bacterium]